MTSVTGDCMLQSNHNEQHLYFANTVMLKSTKLALHILELHVCFVAYKLSQVNTSGPSFRSRITCVFKWEFCNLFQDPLSQWGFSLQKVDVVVDPAHDELIPYLHNKLYLQT